MSFDEDDTRPFVKAYVSVCTIQSALLLNMCLDLDLTAYLQRPAFHVGDKVYFSSPSGAREGPYVVASVSPAGRYGLAEENGQTARNGAEVGLDSLVAA